MIVIIAGTTRKKIAAAGGAIVETIGKVSKLRVSTVIVKISRTERLLLLDSLWSGQIAVIAGTREQREATKDYIRMVVYQKGGAHRVPTEGRTDVTTVELIPGVTFGYGGDGLRAVEKQTNTFCVSQDDQEHEVAIFSTNERNRERAKQVLLERLEEARTTQLPSQPKHKSHISSVPSREPSEHHPPPEHEPSSKRISRSHSRTRRQRSKRKSRSRSRSR